MNLKNIGKVLGFIGIALSIAAAVYSVMAMRSGTQIPTSQWLQIAGALGLSVAGVWIGRKNNEESFSESEENDENQGEEDSKEESEDQEEEQE